MSRRPAGDPQHPGHQLAANFYSQVEHDRVLRQVYTGGASKCAVDNLSAYLTQLFGGPQKYSEARPILSLREAHERFRIGPEHRQAWLYQMRRAMKDLAFPEPVQRGWLQFFEHMSAWVVNQPHGTADEAVLSREFGAGDSADPAVHDMARRWDALRTLELAVVALRKLDGPRTVALIEGEELASYFDQDPGALLSLFAIMSRTGVMPEYVLARLKARPEYAHTRYTYGRTLLHDAAGQGSVPVAELLLRLGADPNARDAYGHTPLYFAGNAGMDPGGAVVQVLVQGGADLNLADYVKRCTPLHMAARRGNVRVAEALLDCGADIEARDIARDTPLRRAVNCLKIDVAELLLSRGADANSVGNLKLTARQAARGAAMKRLLESYIGR